MKLALVIKTKTTSKAVRIFTGANEFFTCNFLALTFEYMQGKALATP